METGEDKKIVMDALRKKAAGYTASESVEEYSAEEEGLRLCRKKVTNKHLPPDVSALKLLLALYDSGQKEVSSMSDEELEQEKRRLIRLLRDTETDEGGGENQEQLQEE